MVSIREFAKLITPPGLARIYRSINLKLGRDPHGLSGNYSTWPDAVAASTGYDSPGILEKTKQALLKVKKGEAAYERDSVLFDEIQYSWPLLAGLMWAAAKSTGKLSVLDFGGSLGSTYFQNRAFLESLSEVRWNIVEQPSHVEVGKEFFEDDRLQFFSGIKDCLATSHPNVVILSSVLQYLEHPYDVFGEIMKLDCDHIIIDRTPFWDGPTDMISVQNVPSSIYVANYPSWIFSTSRFLSVMSEKDYKLIAEFKNPDNMTGQVDFAYKGMIIGKTDVMSKI